MADRLPTRDPRGRQRPGVWWRQGVVWWGIAVFVASMAGCVWLIVVAQRYADPPIPVAGTQVLSVPLTRPASPPAAKPSPAPASSPASPP